MTYTPYTANLLHSAVVEFHKFVCEHLDHDSLPVTAYLSGWDETRKDQTQQLIDCTDELIREYAEELWQTGYRLNQAFIMGDDALGRTLYAKGDDGKTYVVVSEL